MLEHMSFIFTYVSSCMTQSLSNFGSGPVSTINKTTPEKRENPNRHDEGKMNCVCVPNNCNTNPPTLFLKGRNRK